MERRVVSIRQLELLVDQMTAHKDLALGRVRSKEARARTTRLWLEVADRVNPEGPARSGREWQKYWNDIKCRVRAKLVNYRSEARQTGGGPNAAVELTPIEAQIADIIGRDVGPIDGARVEGQVVMEEAQEEDERLQHVPVTTQEIEIEFLDNERGSQINRADHGRRQEWSSDSENSMTAQPSSTVAQIHTEEERASTSGQTNANNSTRSTSAQANVNGPSSSAQANEREMTSRDSHAAARRQRRQILRGRRRLATQRQDRPQSVAQPQDELTSVQSSLARIEILRAEANRAQAISEQRRAEAALIQAKAARTNFDTLALVGQAIAASIEKISVAISRRLHQE